MKINKFTDVSSCHVMKCFPGEGRVVVMVVCWWVCRCVNEVSMEVAGCGDRCVFGGVGGWVGE